MRIGDVKIEHPFVQAALSGYSDLPMRRVARMHGAAYTLNQVILSRTLQHDGDWQRRVLAVPADDHPVAAQLMGSEPDAFAAAAASLADAGYDVVDINFGCPVHKVMRRCRGGYLLSVPSEALAIVGRVLDGVAGRVPVTLKMRRGLDDSPGSERDFFTILDGAFAMGVAAVTVHGRTVAQRYAGPSDWNFLAKVKRHAGDARILGSGDLFTPSDCLAMMERTGVDGVTIRPAGRWAIRGSSTSAAPWHPGRRCRNRRHWRSSGGRSRFTTTRRLPFTGPSGPAGSCAGSDSSTASCTPSRGKCAARFRP